MQFIRNGSAGSVYGDGASQQLVPIHGFSDFFRSNRGMQAAWMGVGVYFRFSSWRRMGADKPSSLSVVDAMSVGVSVNASRLQ